jgi:DNA-binding transcriptional ArsR family regulator
VAVVGQVSDLQRILAALASPVRRQILWLVWDESLPAGVIASAFPLSAPTISEHLAVLLDTGLVTVQIDGSFRRYRADQPTVVALQSLLLDEQQQAHGVPPA